jgi:hypothetical protein
MARLTKIDKEIQDLPENAVQYYNALLTEFKNAYGTGSALIDSPEAIDSVINSYNYYFGKLPGGIEDAKQKILDIRASKYMVEADGSVHDLSCYLGRSSYSFLAPVRAIRDNNNLNQIRQTYTQDHPELTGSDMVKLFKRYGRAFVIGRGYYSVTLVSSRLFVDAKEAELQKLANMSDTEKTTYLQMKYEQHLETEKTLIDSNKKLEAQVINLSNQIAATQRIGWH